MRCRARPVLFLALCASLAGCATARVYSTEELAAVARTCGVAQGEVMQEPDYPRILFLLAPGLARPQFDCVKRWSDRRRLHLSYIDSIEWTDQ